MADFMSVNKGYVLDTVVIVFASLEITLVAARFYARRLSNAAIGLDDYFIVLALILCLGMCANAVAMVRVAHVGQHVEAVMMLPDGKDIIVCLLKFVTSFAVLYPLALTAGKSSICCFYLRLFKVQQRFKSAVYAVWVLQIAWNVGCIVALFTQCRPVEKQWHPDYLQGSCVNLGALYGFITLPNIVVDIALLLLPLPIIWRLKLDRRQKSALIFVFLFGTIPVIASCVRTALFFINIQRGLNDVTWTSVESISLTNAEPGIIVIAACLPILRPLFTVLQAKLAEVSAPWSRTRCRSSSALDRSSGGSEQPRKFAHYIALDEIGGTKIGSNTSTSYSSQAAIR